ncbi:hypothetical protein L4D00_11655 [Photobacterium swingsii]|uniref:hypothetical protein n=1 Tax=Photobacterium swingsii TaxID=680026 RepID=UPI003D14F33E
MNNRNDELILNKLSQVETLLGLATSILLELKSELKPKILEEREFFETKVDEIKPPIGDIAESTQVESVPINTASLCDFISHDPTYRGIESDVLRLIDRDVESSPRANYFIHSYVKKLADRNIQSTEQLRELVLQHKDKIINHAKNITSSNESNGTVIFGVTLHYLLNQL